MCCLCGELTGTERPTREHPWACTGCVTEREEELVRAQYDYEEAERMEIEEAKTRN